MEIKGLEGLSTQQLVQEIQRGGKFVYFEYCISLIIITFRRPSEVYFLRAGEGATGKALPFILCSFLLGWWGIPWGPIYTIGSLYTNFNGGKDVTHDVMNSLMRSQAPTQQQFDQAVHGR